MITVNATRFAPSNFRRGDRVRLEAFSTGADVGTFVEYGPANVACPDTHVSTPGMRIAYVQHDRYGRLPVWERDLTAI